MLREEASQIARPQNADFISDIPALSSNDTEIPSNLVEFIDEIQLLFAGDLNPVAPKAQKKVPIPVGLNLDEWINPPPEDDSSSSSEDEKTDLFVSNSTANYNNSAKTSEPKIELSDGEIDRIRQARKQEESMNPHYLKSSNKPSHKQYDANDDGCEDIPIAEIALEIPLQIHCKNNFLFSLDYGCR